LSTSQKKKNTGKSGFQYYSSMIKQLSKDSENKNTSTSDKNINQIKKKLKMSLKQSILWIPIAERADAFLFGTAQSQSHKNQYMIISNKVLSNCQTSLKRLVNGDGDKIINFNAITKSTPVDEIKSYIKNLFSCMFEACQTQLKSQDTLTCHVPVAVCYTMGRMAWMGAWYTIGSMRLAQFGSQKKAHKYHRNLIKTATLNELMVMLQISKNYVTYMSKVQTMYPDGVKPN